MVLQGGPFRAPIAGFRRFTVPEYHKLIEIGMLTEDDRVELLEGYLVEKTPHDPIHDGTLQKINRRLLRAIPNGWDLRIQMVATLGQSEPEPDGALVRDDPSGYMTRHPGPADFGIAIEVSNTTLDSDRTDKLAIYSRAKLPVYWIVNLIDMQIEVYEQPSGPTVSPDYATRRTYKPGDAVPLVLDGNVVGTIQASDLLP
jgi:Uma2 family endonuclease